MISFDEFKKIDIRVGKIVSAEDHPNADKLTVLNVDMGGEERQIVAGIRGHYASEDLAGRLIAVVVNLEPAVLRGIESQGMLLAALDEDRVVLLEPAADVAPGSKVL